MADLAVRNQPDLLQETPKAYRYTTMSYYVHDQFDIEDTRISFS